MSQYIKTANGQSTISNYQHSTDNQVVKVGATDLYWDGSRITYEQSGSTGTSYVLGLAVEGISGADKKSYSINGKGDVEGIQGAAYSTLEYDAYGNAFGDAPDDYGYRGYYRDKNSGLYMTGARWYDPSARQFTQQDTYYWDNYAMNLYGYCSADPVNNIDPSGHMRMGIGTKNDPKEVQRLKGMLTAAYITDNDGYVLDASGSFDKYMQQAVSNLQKASGITASGVIDDATYSALISRLEAMPQYKNGEWDMIGPAPAGWTRRPWNWNISDISSSSPTTIKLKLRDVTREVNNALAIYVKIAREMRTLVIAQPLLYTPILHATFYGLVTHGGPWDIKRKNPWMTTIGTIFPGAYNTPIVYNGMLMTPEILGNYTYGYLGAAFGYSFEALVCGSVGAAVMNGGLSTSAGVVNEIGDWKDVRLGYNDGLHIKF